MPDLSPLFSGLTVALVTAGFLLGWLTRASRVAREKAALNAGWQDQVDAQKAEHERITAQNRTLMEQVSQFRSFRHEADARAAELGEGLRTIGREKQTIELELRIARSNLEVACRQRDSLKQASAEGPAVGEAQEKDEKIFRLSRELESWQNRLPPLLEKFRERDSEARRLAAELEAATARLASLQAADGSTSAEPIVDVSLAAQADASNEQYGDTEAPEARAVGKSVDDASARARDAGAPELDVDFDLDSADGDEPSADRGETAGEFFEVFAPVAAAEGDGESPCADSAAVAKDATADSGRAAPSSSADPAPVALLTHQGAARAADGNDTDADTDRMHAAALRVADDLKAIRGIGPAVEKTLNDLGYHRFMQIADLSAGDIERIARELRGFKSRIYRDDWIGQARTLERLHRGEPA